MRKIYEIHKQHFKDITDKDNKINDLVNINDKLISEISEKDKMLMQKDKTIHDYSIQIRCSQQTEEENNANKVSKLKHKIKL